MLSVLYSKFVDIFNTITEIIKNTIEIQQANKLFIENIMVTTFTRRTNKFFLKSGI